MASKIKVYGKSQNRTALGVIHAYLLINPQTTLATLRKAFPNSVCPDAGVKELFLTVDEAEQFNTKMGLYFTKSDEALSLSDGAKIALGQIWSKTSLDQMAQKAKKYDIVTADPDRSREYPAAGFSFEYLNGWKPTKDKKGCLGSLLFLIMAGAASGAALAAVL